MKKIFLLFVFFACKANIFASSTQAILLTDDKEQASAIKINQYIFTAQEKLHDPAFIAQAKENPKFIEILKSLSNYDPLPKLQDLTPSLASYFNPSTTHDFLDCSNKSIAPFTPTDTQNDDYNDEEIEEYYKDLPTPLPLAPLIEGIKQWRGPLLKINLSYNNLFDEGVQMLTDALCESHPEIRFISIEHNYAENESIKYFLTKILDFKEIKRIDIRRNFGGDLPFMKSMLRLFENDPEKETAINKKVAWRDNDEMIWE